MWPIFICRVSTALHCRRLNCYTFLSFFHHFLYKFMSLSKFVRTFVFLQNLFPINNLLFACRPTCYEYPGSTHHIFGVWPLMTLKNTLWHLYRCAIWAVYWQVRKPGVQACAWIRVKVRGLILAARPSCFPYNWLILWTKHPEPKTTTTRTKSYV